MRIAIIGVGGVGGYFGGRLAEAGEDIAFLARGRTLDALRRRGLRIVSPLGDAHLHSVEASADPAGIGVVDLVLVCVKAWQVPEVAASLPPLIGEGTAVLPLQNGVEAASQLAAELGPEAVLDGLCKIISMIDEPGVIHHLGAEPFIEFAERDSAPSGRVEAIAATLENDGVTVVVSDDVRAAVWRKFLFIASLGGIGAVTRAPIGILRETPEARVMLEEAMREIAAVAEGHGVQLPPEAIEETMRFIDGLPADGTASMQRDLMAGRPSELESQPGAVVRLGRAVGVPTPLNEFVYHSLLPQERQARDSSPG